MSDPYEKAKTGRLTYKGGSLATLKSIDKKKKKKKKNKSTIQNPTSDEPQPSDEAVAGASVIETDDGATVVEDIYTIDAAKRMKYDELFPVEAKKFGYEPKTVSKSVEQALDDRVKKKADRYCK